MHNLFFISADKPVNTDLISKYLPQDLVVADIQFLTPKIACFKLLDALPKMILDEIRVRLEIDIIQRSADTRPIKLFMADMDSTIVAGETLDDIADKAGIGTQISLITQRAMAGEIDFKQALIERVMLLKNQPVSLIDDVLKDIQFNKGTENLLQTLKSKDVYCVLVSGGFTQFTSVVAEKLGFDAHFGNDLIIENDVLTGEVKEPILDKDFKLQCLHDHCTKLNITPDQVMAIGDGANDLPMLEAAGLGIGYRPKQILADTLDNLLFAADMDCLGAIL